MKHYSPQASQSSSQGKGRMAWQRELWRDNSVSTTFVTTRWQLMQHCQCRCYFGTLVGQLYLISGEVTETS